MKRRDILVLLAGIVALASCGDTNLAGKPVVDETTNGFQARLFLPDGSPAVAARVAISSAWRLAGDTGGTSMTLTSDVDGVVDIPPLAIGEYWLEASGASDGIRLQIRSTPSAALHDTSWQLRPLGSLAGSATAFARIRAYGSQRSWTADSLGRFRLEGLPPGRWSLRVDPPGSDSVLAETVADLAPGRSDSASFSDVGIADLSSWKHVHTHVVRPDPGASTDSLPLFAVPVRIDDRAFTSGLRTPDQLRILTSTGEPATFDIESWDASARSAALWARLPVAHPRRGDTLLLVWGKSGLPAREEPPEPDPVYGVWHLDGSDPFAEATGKGPSIRSDTATATAPGVVGDARAMNRASAMRIAPPRFEAFDSAFTVSCWVLLDAVQHNHAKIFDLGETGAPFGTALFDIDSATGLPALQLAFADGTWKRVVARAAPSGWTQLAATWDGTGRVARFYVDGELVDTLSKDERLHSYLGHDLILGNQETGDDGMSGRLDEFRLDLAVRSAAWIRHSWFSQHPDNSELSPLR